MLEIVTSIFCFALFAIFYFFLMKKVLKSEEKITSPRNIIFLTILVIIDSLSYTPKYLIAPVLVKVVMNIIIYKIIFNKHLLRITLSFITLMIVTLFADIITVFIINNFISLNQMRNNWYYMLLSNGLVILIMLLIFKTTKIENILQIFLKNVKEQDYISLSFFYGFIYTVSILILYRITIINKVNIEYIINMSIIFLSIIISYFIVKTTNKYNKLLLEYDTLFNYVNDFEEIVDNISINNHELKNELIILKNCIETKNQKEALNILNEITEFSQKSDKNLATTLRTIPKGGLKGLIYYKILFARSKKVNIDIDISKTITKYLKKLTINEYKILCRIVGIYIDNAIESAIDTNDKLVLIEIYTIDNKNIEIVISNSFNESKMNINNIGKKGYTTKGNGHGRGTYLAYKNIAKNEWLDGNNEIFNRLYIQRVTIHTNKIKKTD